jgi:hypothetical protein
MKLRIESQWELGQPVLSCFAAPLRLGSGGIDAVVIAYSNSAGSNPWIEMFSFPEDTLKLAVFDLKGRKIWQRDLGPGVLPNPAFCPVFPFDLDGDGADELYFVNNIDPEHPLAISKYRLERVESSTGKTTGQWIWPGYNSEGPMSNAFRNFIAGGYVKGKPVLLTAQGLYQDMYLQAWNPDMSLRWELEIAEGSRGARGSHMHPVVDLNEDGVDEWMWGERCIEIDGGSELFCADDDTYSGHSDIIQPFRDVNTGKWMLFVTREKQSVVPPRVAVYDAGGKRIWGDVDKGHMHIGWMARFTPEKRTAMAIRVASQVQTKKARMIGEREVFAYDVATGQPETLPFDPFQTIPVDLNGDGFHELVRGTRHDGNCSGEVLDGMGRTLGTVGGPVLMASKFLDRPGEQVMTYSREGTIRIWVDDSAVDTEMALARYNEPFYRLNQRFTICGNHLHVLGGI